MATPTSQIQTLTNEYNTNFRFYVLQYVYALWIKGEWRLHTLYKYLCGELNFLTPLILNFFL